MATQYDNTHIYEDDQGQEWPMVMRINQRLMKLILLDLEGMGIPIDPSSECISPYQRQHLTPAYIEIPPIKES